MNNKIPLYRQVTDELLYCRDESSSFFPVGVVCPRMTPPPHTGHKVLSKWCTDENHTLYAPHSLHLNPCQISCAAMGGSAATCSEAIRFTTFPCSFAVARLISESNKQLCLSLFIYLFIFEQRHNMGINLGLFSWRC